MPDQCPLHFSRDVFSVQVIFSSFYYKRQLAYMLFLKPCFFFVGIGQASLSGQPLDLWPLWQVLLPRTLSGYAHG